MNITFKLPILVFAASLFVIGCGTDDTQLDPCEGITCEDGYECINGNCEEKLTTVTGELSSNATWTADQIWIMEGKVIVPSGITLTIEAGTIIKGAEGSEASASALVVARGGKVEAAGTASSPIIFTSVLDNIQVGETAGTNLAELDNEKWGGIIILGNAKISAGDGDTEANIEGIPADEGYGKYGGSDDGDDSGTLTYVSIRHGGITIGEGNEINGLTLGGVGNGTTINHVEVFATLDDGIEFFGGSVDVDNAVVAYQGDDGIDIDQNYSGTLTNFVVVHGGSDTDEALEIDGPEGSTYTDGLFTLRDGTLIAADTEKTSGADLKSKAQGIIDRCSWTGYSKHIKIRASYTADPCADKSDAYTNVLSGALVMSSSDVATTLGASEVASGYIDTDDAAEQACFDAASATIETEVDNMISGNGNAIVGTPTRGADTSVFGWTLAKDKSLF